MITMRIQVQNLEQLRSNFHRAPQTALKYLSKATKAGIFEVEKQAVDRNFQFKTPRHLRTGRLALSFANGRYIAPGGLSGSIGPTALSRSGFYYPGAVYYGTRYITPNPYMDRIAKAAEPDVSRHFEKAVELFVDDLGKV